MIEALLERGYYFMSFGVVSYAVFWLNASPWYFALVVLMDLIYFGITSNLNKNAEGGRREPENRA